jgi:hypothetical protein
MLYSIIGDSATVIEVHTNFCAAYPDGARHCCLQLAKSMSLSSSGFVQHHLTSVSSHIIAALAAAATNSIEGGSTSSGSWP